MRFLFIITLTLFSVSAFASDYECRPRNLLSRLSLMKEKELTFRRGAIQVMLDDCTITENLTFPGLCTYGENTLMVSVTNAPSILVTKRGAVHKLSCIGKGLVERQQQQQQQQQQEQQEEEPTDVEPGTGGGTKPTQF